MLLWTINGFGGRRGFRGIVEDLLKCRSDGSGWTDRDRVRYTERLRESQIGPTRTYTMGKHWGLWYWIH
jgi:hypothetical protein